MVCTAVDRSILLATAMATASAAKNYVLNVLAYIRYISVLTWLAFVHCSADIQSQMVISELVTVTAKS